MATGRTPNRRPDGARTLLYAWSAFVFLLCCTWFLNHVFLRCPLCTIRKGTKRGARVGPLRQASLRRKTTLSHRITGGRVATCIMNRCRSLQRYDHTMPQHQSRRWLLTTSSSSCGVNANAAHTRQKGILGRTRKGSLGGPPSHTKKGGRDQAQTIAKGHHT